MATAAASPRPCDTKETGMKKTLATLTLVGTLALSLALPAAALTGKGAQAPDFTLTTLDGKQEITLSELQGKVVYIDFWASWCGPCRKALPEVQALWHEFRDEDFLMLGVNLDRKLEAGLKYVEAKGVDFPSVFDEGGKVATSFGVRSIPSMLIIGPDGKVAYSEVGFNHRALPEIKSTITRLLGKDGKDSGGAGLSDSKS